MTLLRVNWIWKGRNTTKHIKILWNEFWSIPYFYLSWNKWSYDPFFLLIDREKCIWTICLFLGCFFQKIIKLENGDQLALLRITLAYELVFLNHWFCEFPKTNIFPTNGYMISFDYPCMSKLSLKDIWISNLIKFIKFN